MSDFLPFTTDFSSTDGLRYISTCDERPFVECDQRPRFCSFMSNLPLTNDHKSIKQLLMQYFLSNESISHDHCDNLYIYLNSNTSIYKWRVEKGNSVIGRAYKGYRRGQRKEWKQQRV